MIFTSVSLPTSKAGCTANFLAPSTIFTSDAPVAVSYIRLSLLLGEKSCLALKCKNHFIKKDDKI